MFVLTQFLCDLVDVQQRVITKDDMRQRWQDGAYRGVKPEYAAWRMGMVS